MLPPYQGEWEIETSTHPMLRVGGTYGGAVILSTSPNFADGAPPGLVDDYNQIVKSVASRYPYVSIDDLYTVLDPGRAYAAVVDGIPARSADGVHITGSS